MFLWFFCRVFFNIVLNYSVNKSFHLLSRLQNAVESDRMRALLFVAFKRVFGTQNVFCSPTVQKIRLIVSFCTFFDFSVVYQSFGCSDHLVKMVHSSRDSTVNHFFCALPDSSLLLRKFPLFIARLSCLP